MKKLKFVSICIIVLFSMQCFACNSRYENKQYTIMYIDNEGNHILDVVYGDLFCLDVENVQKTGYEFLGYFDAECGGKQYTTAGGASIKPFTNTENITLYPRYDAMKYTLVLDYQGGDMSGERQFTAEYDSNIPELPKSVIKENMEFVGWYTEPDCGGTMISDKDGLVPIVSKVIGDNFDLSDDIITVYAGFELKKYTVRLHVGANTEELNISYGTPINKIVSGLRKDGKCVLTWSTQQNDVDKEYIYEGVITSSIELWAAEFAPAIDFDSNGGENADPIVARVGAKISLPIPERENYKFVCWKDINGNTFTDDTMPENGAKLQAEWQAMIIFDTNGGAEVKNISEPYGTGISLPQTEKDGYMFADWYDPDERKYESTKMPRESVILTAKYYEVKTLAKVILSENSEIESWYETPNMNKSLVLDLSELYDIGVKEIDVTIYYQSEDVTNTTGLTSMVWFTEDIPSDAYKVWEYTDKKHTSTKSWTSQKYSKTLQLNTARFYICLCHNGRSSTGRWKNILVEVKYPDTSTLY